MKFFDCPLNLNDIEELRNKWGDYLKVTVDIDKNWVVAGGELHADAERVLLEKGSQQDNIWGGGISLSGKQIDTTAVLNLRPRLNNDNLEILDSKRREKFLKIVKSFFEKLWA